MAIAHITHTSTPQQQQPTRTAIITTTTTTTDTTPTTPRAANVVRPPQRGQERCHRRQQPQQHHRPRHHRGRRRRRRGEQRQGQPARCLRPPAVASHNLDHHLDHQLPPQPAAEAAAAAAAAASAAGHSGHQPHRNPTLPRPQFTPPPRRPQRPHSQPISQSRCPPPPHLLRLLLATAMLLLAATYPPPANADCPRQCECKWKSGKESVQCLRANLTGLPAQLDAGTQLLDLTGNELAAIGADMFVAANLWNLQKLFIAKCRVRTVDRWGLRKLKNLVELDLSWNVLEAVPTHAFDSTPELRDLKLTGNPIAVLEADGFGNVPQLVRLELTDCRLEVIERRAFAGLEGSLEWLKIDGNRLATVQAATFTALRNLHNLELARNPWNCTCALRELRGWMLREKIPYEVPPVCWGPPRLAARTWDKIELDDFACRPRVAVAAAVVHAVEGANVTLVCRVVAEPEAHVQWWLRSRLLANLSAEVSMAAVSQGGRKLYMARWWPAESNLTIVGADMQDAGVYNCTAGNNAGWAETAVVLQMSRRPPAAQIGVRMVLASLAAAVGVVVLCAGVVYVVCGQGGKGLKGLRWKKRRRTESCENIEMTFDAAGKRLDNGAGPKPYGENGISVVGQTQKNNRYRSVPSDDEGSLYEETTATGSGGGASSTTTATAGAAVAAASGACGARQPDVHVPRLIDFCDQIPSSASTLDGCPFDPNKSEYSSPQKAVPNISLYTKPAWNQQQLHKHQQQQQLLQQQQQQQPHNLMQHQQLPVDLKLSGSDTLYSSFERRLLRGGANSTVATNSASRSAAALAGTKLAKNCDTTADSTYPDLLEISSLSLSAKLRPVNTQSAATNKSPLPHPAAAVTAAVGGPELPFSTYPRQKPSPARTKSAAIAAAAAAAHFSDSQSLLLASSNAHLLSNLSINMKQQHQAQQLQRHTMYQQQHQQGPLSPLHSPPPQAPPPDDNHQLASSSALLNNNPVGSMIDVSGSGAIIATAQAYDYHAAQLERFLEEYRNLQQQLCRMKETCDSIRHKEAPTHRLAVAADSMAATADAAAIFGGDVAALAGAAGVAGASGLTLDEAGSPNHKVLMRKSSGGSRQPPDPPPYWLHRTAILKRLQAAQASAAGAGGGGAGTMATSSTVVGSSAAGLDNGNGSEVKEYFRPQS